MDTEKGLSLCLKLLAQTASDQGDGVVAAVKLQNRMEQHGLDFEAVFDYLCRHEREYAYQAENFFSLVDRAQAFWEATNSSPNCETPCHVSLSLMVVDRSSALGNATVDNPGNQASYETGADRIKVSEHARRSRKGGTFTVRSHWRQRTQSAHHTAWRHDPAATPGDNYEWIESHERWHCHAGNGRKIRVRGYWRRKPATFIRKAA
jgi:hypothetical protein